jgi:hypothetical protein
MNIPAFLSAVAIGLLQAPLLAGTYGPQDFNSFAVGTTDVGGGTITGATVASVPNTTVVSVQNRPGSPTDRALRISQDGIDNTRGSFKLPALDPAAAATSFDVSFKLMQYGPNTLADGCSINYGTIPTAATEHGSGETGFGMANGMFVGFDTYFNGPDDAPRITVWANGVRLANVTVAFNLNDQTFHSVALHWDAGGLDVTYDGAPIVTNLALSGFVPKPGDRFAFSTRTGGEEQDTMIDDLQISTNGAGTLTTSQVVITEFLADNGDGIEDEDSDTSDWIELYNGTGADVNLAGWHLTNLPGNLALWTFPSGTLTHGSYLRIFASGKNRADPTGVLHTNFTLNKDGGYLALVKPDGTTKTSEFNYGQQSEDVSFGTYGAAQTPKFLLPPTPGSANESAAVLTGDGPPAEEVVFSRPGGLISGAVPLGVAPPLGVDAVVRYTTDGTVPDENDPIFPAAPMTISTTTNLRARVFQPGRLPGDVNSRTFLLLDPSLTSYGTTGQPFASNLPIIVVESYGTNIDAVKNPLGARPYRNVYTVVLGKDPLNGNLASVAGPVDFQGRGGMHVRGNSSTDFGQKGYAWETWNNEDTDKAVSILGMPSDADWVLGTMYNDKTLMRNVLPYTLNREVNGNGGAVRTQFVEVFFNQDGGPISYADYRGVYVFSERIERSSDRIDIAKISPLATDPATLSGGYIFKHDKPTPGGDFSTTSNSAWGAQQYYMVDPVEFTPAQTTALQSYVQAFDNALSGANFTDPVLGYKAFIEPQTFVDNHLWVEVFKQIDGFWLSTYYVKDRGGKIRALPIWDYNLSTGNANYNQSDVTNAWFYTIASATNYAYYFRLFLDPDFNLKYWDRYWQLRRSVFRTNYMLGKIDAWANELTNNNAATSVTNGASIPTGQGDFFPTDKANNLPPSLENPPRLESPVMRHFDRWPVLGVYVWPNSNGYASRTTFQSEVQYLKDWITARMTWIDSQHSLPPAFSNSGGNVPAGTTLTITNPNASGTIYYTTDGSDPAAAGTGSSQTLVADTAAPCKWLVPSAANGGSALTAGPGAQQWTTYTDPPNIANWTSATSAIGYDRNTAGTVDYLPFLGTNANTESQMFGINATCYIRFTFNIPSQAALDAIGGLELAMRYDDGFRAYINGTVVTGRNDTDASMTTNPSTAKGSQIHLDNPAIVFEPIDITPLGKPALRVGTNVLALHALNAVDASSSDLLMSPRLIASSAGNAQVYSGPLTLNNTAMIRARVQIGGAWGPITEASYVVNAAPASAANLVVSEFAYDPQPSGNYSSKDLEFIVLRNISAGNVDLTGVQFTDGVLHTLAGSPQQLTLAPGAEAVVAANPAALVAVHGAAPAGVSVFGPFEGALDNSGELLGVRTAANAVIKEFTYSKLSPWPDGAGGSLVLEHPSTNPDHADGHHWRRGTGVRGTPWTDDSLPFTGSWLADTDLDGYSDGIEYALGTSAANALSRPQLSASLGVETVGVTTGKFLRFTFHRGIANDQGLVIPELSLDFATWQPNAMTRISSTDQGDGTVKEIWRSNAPIAGTRAFARLRLVSP